jgi:TRAP-type mannitol/chloroaromatic compound transport system permease small subunit
MQRLQKVAGLIDAVSVRMGRLCAWAVLASILVSVGNAIARYGWSRSSNALIELQWYLFGAVFLVCASWTLQANEHVRVDLLRNRLHPRTRIMIDLAGHVLFLLPMVIVMLWTCWPYVLASFASGERSANAGGLLLWPAKALLLVGMGMLGLQCLSEMVKRAADLSRPARQEVSR